MAAKENHPVPPIITPLLVIPLPKSSSADLDEPIPFLLVQFHSGLRTGPDPQVWRAPPVYNLIHCTHPAPPLACFTLLSTNFLFWTPKTHHTDYLYTVLDTVYSISTSISIHYGQPHHSMIASN